MRRHGEPEGMTDSNAHSHGGEPGRPRMRGTAPLVGYAILWIGGAVGVVLLALWITNALDNGTAHHPPAHRPVDGVLASARAAGCSFTHVDGPLETSRRPPWGAWSACALRRTAPTPSRRHAGP